MRSRPACAAAVVEPLELRQLLTAGAVVEAPEVNPSHSPTLLAVSAPVTAAAPTATGTSIERFVGLFRGTGSNPKGRFELNWFNMQVVVESASATGFVGSVAIDTTPYGGNWRQVTGTFTGKLHPKGGFAFRFLEPGRRVAFRGRLTPVTDRVVGYVRIKIGPGVGMPRGTVSGDYRLERVPSSLPDSAAPATLTAAPTA